VKEPINMQIAEINPKPMRFVGTEENSIHGMR
jgi:hypothetical protein